jgi:pimeloyl-ACP methyl ester carboxylesterase/glycine cleavage system regulatory protein
MRRLTTRGCRVFAPALPSFGGTANLPADEMNLDGYADWVASFMFEVGITEPVLMIGHSFGGGVAIKFARNQPSLVRYLVLLNAIGCVSSRHPWDWAIGISREFWPPSETLALMRAMRGDLLFNFLRNPFGLAQVGVLAQRTDLREELADLRALGVPVLALTSDRDKIIPHAAFESVCEIVGADGRVVSGGHAWLLVHPDSFDEVLASTIDVQVAEHGELRAASRRTEIERLLEETHLSKQIVRSLLESASPLWLLSDSASALAGDLVLCRPTLKKDEIRAIARNIESSTLVRVTIAARDRRGLLADSAAVLTTNGLSICNASAATWSRQHLAIHSFIVSGGVQFNAASWDALGEQLRTMVATGSAPPPQIGPLRPVSVVVEGAGDRSIVKVVAPDEPGLLATICRYFQTHKVNIESLQARTRHGVARDTFLVIGTIEAEDLQAHLAASFDSRSIPTVA